MTDKIKRRGKRGKPLTKKQRDYKDKPEFSAKMRRTARRSYRKSQGSDFELEGNTVLRSLTFLDEAAKMKRVTTPYSKKAVNMPVVTPTELAKLLNTTYQTLWRWTTPEIGLLPAPIIMDSSTGRKLGVYHRDEVEAMIEVIGQHLNEFKYYRKDHTKTRDKLFDAITTARAIIEKDAQHGN